MRKIEAMQRKGWGFIYSKDEDNMYRIEVIGPKGEDSQIISTSLEGAFKGVLIINNQIDEENP